MTQQNHPHLAAFQKILGDKGVITDAAIIAPHLQEWRGKFHGQSDLLLKPTTTAEVSEITKYCNTNNLKLIIQGGLTGLCGGATPLENEIMLSLERMTKIRDKTLDSLTIEAGATVQAAQQAANDIGRLFPLHLASQGSAQIGGTIATNAGGINVLKYGMMRDLVLGLEVVLASGEILGLLTPLRKNNTGPDLKQLFIGSEGTLGIVTAATLKLFPKPEDTTLLFLSTSSLPDIINLFHTLSQAFPDQLTACEYMSGESVALAVKHIPNVTNPLPARDHYLLVEISHPAAQKSAIEDALGTLLTQENISDALLAKNTTESANLWKLRESISAAQKHEGASIKHDISLPLTKIPEFIEKITRAAGKFCPGIRPIIFGHIGDGNLHTNFSMPIGMDAAEFLAKWEDLNRLTHDLVMSLGGSFSAEHGIGLLKKAELLRYKSAPEIALMRSLKQQLDPKSTLNPGRILD